MTIENLCFKRSRFENKKLNSNSKHYNQPQHKPFLINSKHRNKNKNLGHGLRQAQKREL